MDGVTNEVVRGFEDSIGGIKSMDDHFVYYSDGTIKSIDQYRNDFNKYREDVKYYNSYENLDTENNKAGNDDPEATIKNGLNFVKSKFAFSVRVSNEVQSMLNEILHLNPNSKFYLNVKSKFYTGRVCIIDLSWYAPFKEFGDSVICIFAYMLFLWNIFIRLPDIISGAGASSYAHMMYSDIEAGKKSSIARRYIYNYRRF